MMYGHMPLWTIVNMFSKVVFHSFYAVQLIESATINIAVCYVVSKYTHRYFLFLLVYFFSLQYFIFNTEVMREGFAMAFVLIGMHGWLSHKKWLFFLCVPIAALFHVAALTVLLFPFMKFRISRYWIVYGLIIAFVIWLASDILLGKIMMTVAGGLGSIVQKVLFYSIKASNIVGFARSAFTYIIFPFIIMYSVVKNEEDEELKRKKEQKLY